jgi:hypothetical protein
MMPSQIPTTCRLFSTNISSAILMFRTPYLFTNVSICDSTCSTLQNR